VLSWGSECEVLEPAELQEDIRREAAAMLRGPGRGVTTTSVAVLEEIREQQKRSAAKKRRTG
jgi:hypothetical protein